MARATPNQAWDRASDAGLRPALRWARAPSLRRRSAAACCTPTDRRCSPTHRQAPRGTTRARWTTWTWAARTSASTMPGPGTRVGAVDWTPARVAATGTTTAERARGSAPQLARNQVQPATAAGPHPAWTDAVPEAGAGPVHEADAAGEEDRRPVVVRRATVAIGVVVGIGVPIGVGRRGHADGGRGAIDDA